jgi:uncharacterized membrane protein YsdA (DUF1294 family)
MTLYPLGFLESVLEAAVFFGVIALLVMGINRSLSKTRLSILEMRLLLMAAILGGSWGIFLGSRLFNHKITVGFFWTLVLLLTISWAVVVGTTALKGSI